ncbi:MAG: hypothetical protein F6K21_02345 [Symploca sp. SIO2D2]|nr:hypothetical protein [Symploca sp. SIO2D2]
MPYYSSLYKLLSPSDLPESLSFVQSSLDSLFEKIFYRNLHVIKSKHGDKAYYSLELITYDTIGVEILGTGLKLVLNPTPNGETAIPIQVNLNWQILKYIKDFDFQNFDNSAKAYYLLLLDLLELEEKELLEGIINVFISGDNPIEEWVNHFNTLHPNNSIAVSPDADTAIYLENIIQALNNQQIDIFEITFTDYLDASSPSKIFNKLENLFKEWLGVFSVEYLKTLLIPQLAVKLDVLTIGIEFPVSALRQVDPVTGEALKDADGNDIPAAVIADAGKLEFTTQQGLDITSALAASLQNAEIGHSGILIGFTGAKLDLSRKKNLVEAISDNRPQDFTGAFIRFASITLPKKWFKQSDTNSTARIAGYNMLIGTGGVSGTIALEAIGDTPNPVLYKRLGNKGFGIGFSHFDIRFQQNQVVESNIEGLLTIPRFKKQDSENPDSENPAEILVQGHLDAEGDFLLTATRRDGFPPLSLPKVFDLTILSLELGKEDDTFFIGTSCTIKFKKGTIIREMMGEQELKIPRLRIYSDGSFEIVSGTIPVPTNFMLNLGPVEIAITGINFSSYQQEYEGQMRKYNCFGFDGAIALGSLGVEAQGKGMQYYYTVDGGDFHSFFRIQTIAFDMCIPASASPETATAIINGYLSIPQPGESKEYRGEVSLKLPKAKIAGSAEMRLQPKYPAFLIDANFSLGNPIPIASTGLAFYGFRGLLGYRYVAEKEAVGLTSGEHTWYDYYNYQKHDVEKDENGVEKDVKIERGVNIHKFSGPEKTKNYKNPISLGAGATLATHGDNGYTIFFRLFLLSSIPNLFLLEGKANVLSKQLELDDPDKEPPFHAFIAYGDDSIEIGMGVDFQLPKNDSKDNSSQQNGWILDMYANLEAGFFFNNPSAWYMHLGTQEKPIDAKVLTLFTAQTYLSLSAKGIQAGARAEFSFNKRFGPAAVKAYLFVEVGGQISFERPQIGAYLLAEGSLEVKFWIVKVSVDFRAIFSVEAPEPFLIYAEVKVCAKARIGFIKIRKCIRVKLKWEKSRKIDRSPIPPLNPDRQTELVKGTHMLTGETFDLAFFENIPDASEQKFDQAIIPCDTYIDIKFSKALLPTAVADLIGGVNNPPVNCVEKMPPAQRIRGKEVRQVKHQYSIESISIKAWNGGNWINYHPYEAIIREPEEQINFDNIKIGQWQKSDKQYNAIRLLANSPFSYTEQGEPGWFIPEQIGITPATLFCEGKKREMICVDWQNKTLGLRYYASRSFSAKTLYLELVGQARDFAHVSDEAKGFGLSKSLAFANDNSLELLLPEPSVKVDLKLSTEAHQVAIKYYGSVNDDTTNEVQHYLISESIKQTNQLKNIIRYQENPTAQTPQVTKVVIEPNPDGTSATSEYFLNRYAQKDSHQYSDCLEVPRTVQKLNWNPKRFPDLPPFPDQSLEKDIYVVGTIVLANGKTVGLVRKLEVSGNIIWEKTYARNTGEDGPWFKKAVPCPNGDLLILGYRLPDNQHSLTRISSNGTVVWSNHYSTNSRSILSALIAGNGATDEYVVLVQGDDGQTRFYQIAGNGSLLSGRTVVLRNPHRNKTLTITSLVYGGGSLYIAGHAPDRSYGTIGFVYQLNKSSAVTKKAYLHSGGRTAVRIQGMFNAYQALFVIGDFGDANFFAKVHLENASQEIYILPGRKEEQLSFATTSTHFFISQSDRVNKFDLQPNLIWTKQLNLDNEGIHFGSQISDDALLFCSLANQAVVGRLNTELKSCRTAELSGLQVREVSIQFLVETLADFASTLPNAVASESLSVSATQSTRQLLCPDGFGGNGNDKTFLFAVCWESVEDFAYNESIPGQDAIEEDYQAAVKAINKLVSPVWRPMTKYCLHFRLKDEVDNGANQGGIYDYYYGFQTVGPIGHFHEDDRVNYIGMNDTETKNPDEYPLTSLRNYIDYQRSYPNANGNLLRAKPLFYGSEDNNNEILLFFTKPYASHLLGDWPEYQGMPCWVSEKRGGEIGKQTRRRGDAETRGIDIPPKISCTLPSLSGEMKVVIKDPVEDITLSNPLPPDVIIEEIPQSIETWDEDTQPRMPENLRILKDFAEEQAKNPDVDCNFQGGLVIKPKSKVRTIKINNLKPQKLYTAIVLNIFEGVAKEVHNFVFKTSRYQNFEQQINSYLLSDGANNESKAIYHIRHSFEDGSIQTAFDIIQMAGEIAAGNSNAANSNLATQFSDFFDRVLEGVFSVPPLAPAITTEFNLLRDQDKADSPIVGILVRNPEPFNDPQMPLKEIYDGTVAILDEQNNKVDAYKMLFAKDYSQVLIMHNPPPIPVSSLRIRFQYKRWNGNEYNIKDTIIISDLTLD